MLESRFLSILDASNREQLEHELVYFTKRIGFETMSATVVMDHFEREQEFLVVDNTPAAYREFFMDREHGKLDPVAQHCKARSTPIVWNQKTYVLADRACLWEHQAQYGYNCGISVAMHLPDGRHFLLGLDRDQTLPDDTAELTRTVAEVHLFAVHAHEAAMRVLVPALPEPDFPPLTPRELEALRWTMEGKTAWEVGAILGIAEQTVVRHVFNAAKKLDCVNKHQAVLKALRLKLIRV